MTVFKRGDRVIYRMSKMSTRPGPRAQSVFPTPHGDGYSYVVEKYWVVTRRLSDHRIEAATRTGKVHHLETDDPQLQKASWLTRFLHRKRFPGLPQNLWVKRCA